MAKAQRPIKYKGNGPIWGLVNQGRKVQDAVTGFYTYEYLLAINDYGDKVDSKGDGLDLKQAFPYVTETF